MLVTRSLLSSFSVKNGISAVRFLSSKQTYQRTAVLNDGIFSSATPERNTNLERGFLVNTIGEYITQSNFGLKYFPKVIDDPLKRIVIESPREIKIDFEQVPFQPVNTISDPNNVIEKKAARLIVIRRRKMKRHKLKKLRKKMKFLWAKVRQRREFRKEKAFQAELMGQISEAQKFNAASYVDGKIRNAYDVPLPKLWRGKKFPEFVIKDLLKKKEQKKQFLIEDKERRSKMKPFVSDYDV